MAKVDRLGWAGGFGVESFGIKVGLRCSEPQAPAEFRAAMPPGAVEVTDTPFVDVLYSLRVGGPGPRPGVRNLNLLYLGFTVIGRNRELGPLVEALEASAQLTVAEWSPQAVFIHAGAVAWKGGVILLPGRSHAGKSTLVAELLRLGATYLSDEYAVVTPDGRVRPYPRRLSLRRANGPPDRPTAADLGAETAAEPLPLRIIVFAKYRPGAEWRPRRLAPGQTALGLLDHAVPARSQPAPVMDMLQGLAEAPAWKGFRGEAGATARLLLAAAERNGRIPEGVVA